MTTAQVVKTPVTNNSLSKDYPHPDDHSRHTTATPGFKPFTNPTSFELLNQVIRKINLAMFQSRSPRNETEVSVLIFSRGLFRQVAFSPFKSH